MLAEAEFCWYYHIPIMTLLVEPSGIQLHQQSSLVYTKPEEKHQQKWVILQSLRLIHLLVLPSIFLFFIVFSLAGTQEEAVTPELPHLHGN